MNRVLPAGNPFPLARSQAANALASPFNAPTKAPMLSAGELAALGKDIAGAAAVGGVAFATSAVTDAIVERTGLGETGRALAQGVTLGVTGSAFMLGGARTLGRGVIAAAVVTTGMRLARSAQWDRRAVQWVMNRFGSNRAEERSGGRAWEDPDIKVSEFVEQEDR